MFTNQMASKELSEIQRLNDFLFNLKQIKHGMHTCWIVSSNCYKSQWIKIAADFEPLN